MLYHGDCVDIMKNFADNSIDLTITSPPYDNLRNYNGYSFDYRWVAQELFRVTTQGGVVIWIVGDSIKDGSETLTSFQQALYFKQIGFNVHDTMIWEKANFSTPSTNRYHQIFEYMFGFSKGKPKTFNPILDHPNKYGQCFGKNTYRQKDGSFKELPKGKPRKFGMRTNIWRMNTVGQEMIGKVPPHPAMFPEQLVNDHILTWSNENDIVLDPMMGSGTTGKVAKLLNREFIGIEISEEYLNLARERIESVNKLKEFYG